MMRIPLDMGPLQVANLLEARADDDELAVEAYELFGRSVFPFEGVFCDEGVTARGPLAESLRLAELPLDELSGWVPAFCCAVRDFGSPLGDAGAETLQGLLAGADSAELVYQPLKGPVPELLEPATALSDLVDWLCTPARCGLFLSAAVLERIARERGVPRGFGSRRRLLTNLLESAARYRNTAEVISSLQAVVERHRGLLTDPSWQTASLQAATEPWLERLAQTSALLGEMQHRLAAAPSVTSESSP